MFSPRRQSPRAAIREWLAHTNQEPSIRNKEKAEIQTTEHKGPNKRQRSPIHVLGDRRQSQRQAKDLRQENQDQLRSQVKGNTLAGSTLNEAKIGRNLADQLGLYAPFRSFATRGDDVTPEVQRDRKRRKRNQRSSTTSSFLEPAACSRRVARGAKHQLDAETASNRHQSQHVGNAIVSSVPSNSTGPSPKKPGKSYERRSRHKTREDRYEFKQGKGHKKIKNDEKMAQQKPSKTKKRVKKSGAALMHTFSANNVEAERLTLQNTVPLGLFGKGRASSPLRRRGLPDLTFSELNFLNHRRAQPEEALRSQGEKSRRKKDKAADTEAEISRYFASSKELRAGEGAGKETSSDRRRNRVIDETYEQRTSSLPPIDLPQKPFLGFGGCGPGYNSPIASVLGTDLPPHEHLSNRSTSYFTWSQSHLSRRSASSNLSHSLRRSSEKPTEPQLKLAGSPRRRERSLSARIEQKLSDEARNLPGLQENSYQGRFVVDRAPSVSLDVPDRPSEPATKEATPSITRTENAYLPLDDSSSATLVSLLASRNRPEILGAVLDALLDRATVHQPEVYQGSRPSKTPHSRGLETIPPSGAGAETQMLHESDDSLVQNQFSAKLNHTNDPNAVASPRQAFETQDSQSMHRLNGMDIRGANPLYSRTSPTQSRPHSNQKTFQTSEQQSTQQNHINNYQIAGEAMDGAGIGNAWIGYGNLYQKQAGMANECRQGSGSNLGESTSGNHDHSGRLQQPDGESSTYGMLNFNLPYGNSHEDQPRVRSSVEDCLNNFHDAKPQLYEAMGENSARQLGEVFDGAEAVHETPLHATRTPLGHLDGVDTGQDFGGYAESVQDLSPTGFLGVGHPAAVHQDELFAPWSSRRHQIPSISRLGISTCGSAADSDAGNEEVLNGFWKPNRLY
ncbi:MAG: hypothetical protein Q9170_004681 [Blastenia crenularia]